MGPGGGATDEWLAVFSDPAPLRPGARLRDRLLYWFLGRLEPQFRHCFALRRATAFDGWVVAEWRCDRMDIWDVAAGVPVRVGPREFSDYGDYVQFMIDAGLAHGVAAWAREPDRWRPRGPGSCVSMVKHLLGLGREARWVMTPRQLYNHLKRREIEQ